MEILIKEISDALAVYRGTLIRETDERLIEDRNRLIKITEGLLGAIGNDDLHALKRGIYAFYWHVSDSFYVQPEEFVFLSKKIAELKEHIDGDSRKSV